MTPRVHTSRRRNYRGLNVHGSLRRTHILKPGVAAVGLIVVLVGCGPDRAGAVTHLEGLFPVLAKYRVTNLYRTDECEYIAYERGTFVTDPESVDCEIDVEGPYPRTAFDAHARADLDAIYAESERVASRLQSAFPEYGVGDSIVGGQFGFQWDRQYVYEPGWSELPPEDSVEVTAVDDDWYEINSELSLELSD